MLNKTTKGEKNYFRGMGKFVKRDISFFKKNFPKGDGSFKILRKINDNIYMLELLEDYGVSLIFYVCGLTPFARLNTEDLRTYRFQEGGYNEGTSERPYVGPITRSRAKGIDEGENFQKTFLLWKVDC